MKPIICQPSSLTTHSASEVEMPASVESDEVATDPDTAAEIGWRIDGGDEDEVDVTDVVDWGGVVAVVVTVGVDKGGIAGGTIDCETLFGDSKMYLSLMQLWNERGFLFIKTLLASYCRSKSSRSANELMDHTLGTGRS